MPRLVFIFALILLSARIRAEETPLGPQPGVLLLRNGSVIEGKVLKSGDKYEVSIQDGDLRVRASEVEFFGRTLAECYEHQRQGINFNQVNDHISLAEWCLRHKLFAQAAHELRDAMECDPSHPKIGLIERRLRMAIEETETRESGEPTRLNAATSEELDRMVRSMPGGTVETFTNVIQPMLLNQCSTAGCHGPASSGAMRLMRVAANRTQSRRVTQRNLHSVLAILDLESPDESKLLTVPIRAHGTCQAPVFTSKQTLQYRQLVAWVFAVSCKEHVEEPTETEPPTGEWPLAKQTTPSERKPKTLKPTPESPTIAAKYLQEKEAAQSISVSPVEDTFPEVKPASAEEPVSDVDGSEPAADRSKAGARLSRRHLPGQNSTRSKPKRGELPKEQTPADPFDPEQFNRRYLGE